MAKEPQGWPVEDPYLNIFPSDYLALAGVNVEAMAALDGRIARQLRFVGKSGCGTDLTWMRIKFSSKPNRQLHAEKGPARPVRSPHSAVSGTFTSFPR